MILSRFSIPSYIIVMLAAAMLPSSIRAAQAAPIRFAVIGDSTVSEYPESRPDRGWGQYVEEQFAPGAVAVVNLAKPGRSTKTFMEEGLWQQALALEPHYVLIQFGHNDSHDPNNPESTDPAGDYRSNLRRYVEESWAIGAKPVLITPMVRRTFDDRGRIVERNTPPNRPLGAYAEAMKEVASEMEVPVIDLFTSSKELVEELGPSESAKLANKPGDPTHFNERGARAMMDLIMQELPSAVPELRKLLRAAGPTAEVGSEAGLGFVSKAPTANSSPQRADDFAIVQSGAAATIVYDPSDAEVVKVAARLFAEDVERVSSVRPTVATSLSEARGDVVIVGVIGKSAAVDALIASGKLDASEIAGGWERFRIEVVEDAFPGVERALVVAGSDRRGAAYGVFSLSEAIGVSPWYWWADTPVVSMPEIYLSSAPYVSAEPSVKYRGIFINDEDWGLQPWAAKTFEPEVGDMGPKTYAKIFELLLRLKANYCWPAMHPSTKAFNYYPENKAVADRYAIVMGSSHCEPMLRNNVDEWDKEKYGEWNPVTNLPTILDYWETRVEENGQFENAYTVGMRGIHDSGVPGGGTIEEKRERLEQIVGLQRGLLAEHVNPDPSQVPQIFCPYKEVLEVYQAGMDLPDDVTIVWPDDNHGYIRQFPNEQERQRSGGHGVYYHISYWGRPHDYLWLESTSPALIWEEMSKAYELGVQRLWVVNVGDIKPIEAGMTFFLDLAWNVDAYGPDVQGKFLRDFYAQQFGPEQAKAIASLKDEYFKLCSIRRPEHMGFNRVYYSKEVRNQPVQNSDWTDAESLALLERWLELARRSETIAKELPEAARDAYYQLVEYPARAGAAMAEKTIRAEKARLTGSDEQAELAKAALRRIKELTARYNTLNDGKWRAMMDHEPRELPVFGMPSTEPQSVTVAERVGEASESVIVIDPTQFERLTDDDGVAWRVVEGLGPRGAAIAVLPRQDEPTLRSPEEIRKAAPFVEYAVESDRAGEVEIVVEALPTRPFHPGNEVIAAVAIDDGELVLVRFGQGNDEHDDQWQANVLRHAMEGTARLTVPEGKFSLRLWAADRALVVLQIKLVVNAAETD